MVGTTDIVLIAVIFGALIFLAGYTLFVPKNTVPFSGTTIESRKGNPILSIVQYVVNDVYAVLPEGAVKRDKKQVDHPELQKLIERSGNPWKLSVSDFIALRWVFSVVGAGLGGGFWAISVAIMPSLNIPWWAVVILGTVIGFIYPRAKYKEVANKRDMEFRRQLPEALDLMQISVSAGRTFPQAIRDALPNMQDGVLKEEFTVVLRRIDSGEMLTDVLKDFATRVPSDGIKTFVNAVATASENNTPLSETLEARARASRQEFFALVTEKTAQLESKIWMILSPTMMPAVLVVAVAPAVVTMMENF